MARRLVFELGCYAADAAQTLSPVAGQLQRRNLGLARGAYAHTNNLTSAIEVSTNWLTNLSADGSQTLGEFWSGDAIAWQTLMIKPLKLFELAGLEPLQLTMNRIDRGVALLSEIRRGIYDVF